jgi:hypothetical protein
MTSAAFFSSSAFSAALVERLPERLVEELCTLGKHLEGLSGGLAEGRSDHLEV